jgi:L-amino acid N-acyltransferase YncA
MPEITIRHMTVDDWPLVQEIYQKGIDTGNATFEVVAPDWEKCDKAHRNDCRLIILSDIRIVG